MAIPETTSAEGLERFVGGQCLFRGRGEAWRKVSAWILELPRSNDSLHLPSVSEPFLALRPKTYARSTTRLRIYRCKANVILKSWKENCNEG
jgi:hypothetical protein